MVGPELSGGKVNLRPVCDADLPRRTEWLNDPETVRLFTGSAPTRVYERVDAKRWRQSLEADLAAVVWAVETKEGRHIGDLDLHSIDRYQRSAKLTILLGDKAFWNQGCGADAIRTLLDHAFSELGMDSVSLRVYDFNERAIRCYEKCGFTRTWATWDDSGSPAGPGEIHMLVTRDHFFMVRDPDVGTLCA